MKLRSKFTPRVETLDDRALMSITLTTGLLEVVGTSERDQIRVTLASPTVLNVSVDSTGESQQFDVSAVSSILVQALEGDDTVVIGPNVKINAEIRAWAGNDTVLGGGGSDKILGGGGNDYIQGRGGNDEIRGQAGDDYLLGQGGDDYVDGQDGNDLLFGGSGTNDLQNGTNLDLEFDVSTITVDGSFSLQNAPPGNGLAKTLTVTGQAAPGGVALILVGDLYIGQFTTDATGSGAVVFQQNYDTNFNGLPDFLDGIPSTFPEITNDTVLSAKIVFPIEQTVSATVGELLAHAGLA